MASVVALFKEEVLEAPDGEVRPLIVRVVRPRDVLLPLPLMRPKNSVSWLKSGWGARSSVVPASFVLFLPVVLTIHLPFPLNSTMKASLALITSPISLSPGSMTRASERFRAPEG